VVVCTIMNNMKKKFTVSDQKTFLDTLNKDYSKLHTKYELNFWDFYMGDVSKKDSFNKSQEKRDAFKSDIKKYEQVCNYHANAQGVLKDRFAMWKNFFEKYQIPEQAISIKNQIDELENDILELRKKRKEGFVHPKTKKFVKASSGQMGLFSATDPDEKVRKACFKAVGDLAKPTLPLYIKLIGLRNSFARELGFEDFYAYKLFHDEGMTKKELFGLWDEIYNKTKYAFKDVRKLEKKVPGLRKPWNFGYMMSGDFLKEEDQYYRLEDMLMQWGISYTRSGFDFADGSMRLDLFERAGKYDNGFCHWPTMVSYRGSTKVPGEARFTCEAIYGQVGSGVQAGNTLFHEGGHAAHILNVTMKDVCVNHEYPPMSTAWAETQSMFIDTLFSSMEWRTRYAKNEQGESYPMDLFERKLEKLHALAPLDLMGIMSICELERRIYESDKLTVSSIEKIAKEVQLKYGDKTEANCRLLDVPHLYSFESSCSYQGYGLAELALAQWRKYFYKKYGYIVDNKNVGKEMKKVWKLGSSKTFPELVKLATGKKLSSKAYIDSVTASKEQVKKSVKKRVGDLNKLAPEKKTKINLKADISMWHGKKKICDSKKSFEEMAEKYTKWMHKEFKK